jgi:type III secretory pathway component EscV
MKKSLVLITIVLTVAFLFSCAGGAETAPKEPEQKADTANYPDYVVNPPQSGDAIFGVGYAKQSTLPLSIKVAETNARADIANQIETQIQSAVTSYMQEAGVGDDKQAIEFVESITRQVTDTMLSGAITVQRNPMPDGGVWVLMQYGKDNFLNTFKDVAESFERSEGAAFAEFKAAQALEKLKFETENNPTTSTPVKE